VELWVSYSVRGRTLMRQRRAHEWGTRHLPVIIVVGQLMKNTIFFSWQSDRPSKEGRTLIEQALRAALAELVNDASVEPALREISIDKDTTGVPGSPAIFETILKKIDSATIFVPDLTFTGVRVKGELTPNPNVLIEYGWALKSRGLHRIVAVMNEAHGEPTKETMPFDMAHLRFPITYNLPDGAPDAERRIARTKLTEKLKMALKAVFESDEFRTDSQKIKEPLVFESKDAKQVIDRFRTSEELIGVPWMDLPGIRSSTDPVGLATGPTMCLRVMPLTPQSQTWSAVQLRSAAQQGNYSLIPFANSNLFSLRASDGFGLYSRDNAENLITSSLAFAFETGEVWSIDTLLLALDPNKIYLADTVQEFAERLRDYSIFLQRLEVVGPYKWIAEFDGIRNRELAIVAQNGYSNIYSNPICLANKVTKSGIYDLAQDPKQALRPFFEELCGRSGKNYPEYQPFI